MIVFCCCLLQYFSVSVCVPVYAFIVICFSVRYSFGACGFPFVGVVVFGHFAVSSMFFILRCFGAYWFHGYAQLFIIFSGGKG